MITCPLSRYYLGRCYVPCRAVGAGYTAVDQWQSPCHRMLNSGERLAVSHKYFRLWGLCALYCSFETADATTDMAVHKGMLCLTTESSTRPEATLTWDLALAIVCWSLPQWTRWEKIFYVKFCQVYSLMPFQNISSLEADFGASCLSLCHLIILQEKSGYLGVGLEDTLCYGLSCPVPNSYVWSPNPSTTEYHCIWR